MPEGAVADHFNVGTGECAARLFSGDLFQNVRGGGFLYTNDQSLSVGTVFDLDSLADERAEPQQLLDSLLTHPLLADWLGDEYVGTNGTEKHVVSLDTQPCVERGTCAVVADTDWTHPQGVAGVEYQHG